MKRLSRVYLIRHGQINGYENFPVYGHKDVDLTETGILQMEKMAERLRLVEFKAIYSSDLKRSATGARLLARSHDVPLYFLPELREIYFGDWEGLTLSQIQKRFPEELKKRQVDLINYTIPGEGETVGHFSERINQCFERILAEQKENDFVIVAHGGVNRVILCNALGLDLTRIFNIHQDYGCLNIIDYFPDSTLVRLVNG
ncbi:MAG: alpha-ribazole phosphatase [Desulfobacteraceae bacterium]|nr:MAG: alpha-ribazole phosphatase [Desulfobacteraceae bacterium]